MIEYSDNTASDLILKHAGDPSGVMKFLKELCIQDIKTDRSTSQIFLEASQNPQGKMFLSEQLDSGTPEAMAKLLSHIVKNKILSNSSAEFLLECMYRCKTGNSRIRALLPSNVKVANKTGTATGFVNDVGLLDLGSEGKIILAIYIKNTSATLGEMESVIAQIAKAIYEDTIAQS
jgi:beta-lactamase class A